MELTPSKRKSQARNHHLAGLYHNTFVASRKSTPQIGVDVNQEAANKLVRAGWAMIHTFGTKVVLGQTKTGARKYDSNCLLNGVHQIPRYASNETVDISEMMNALFAYSNHYLTKWY